MNQERLQKISAESDFRAKVDIVDSSIAGVGCCSKSSLKIGDPLGRERPFVSCASVFSEWSIPACHVCFRHSLSFRELVKMLISDKREVVSIHTNISCGCPLCSTRLCRICSTDLNVRSHEVVCHQGNDHRRGLLNGVRTLANEFSESILVALRFCAILSVKAVDRQVSPDVVFRTDYNQEGYFDSHISPVYLENGYRAIAALMHPSPMISELVYNRIISTFDRTNLYIEVESFSMMEDLQQPIDRLDELKDVYEGSSGFSAITPDHPDDFPIPVVVGSAHYPTVARLNHSCDPNIDWQTVDGTNEIEIFAIRDINQGEELFISYIDQSKPKLYRRAQLQSLYGFTCKCSKCELE